jgi:hypothetical protein
MGIHDHAFGAQSLHFVHELDLPDGVVKEPQAQDGIELLGFKHRQMVEDVPLNEPKVLLLISKGEEIPNGRRDEVCSPLNSRDVLGPQAQTCVTESPVVTCKVEDTLAFYDVPVTRQQELASPVQTIHVGLDRARFQEGSVFEVDLKATPAGIVHVHTLFLTHGCSHAIQTPGGADFRLRDLRLLGYLAGPINHT